MTIEDLHNRLKVNVDSVHTLNQQVRPDFSTYIRTEFPFLTDHKGGTFLLLVKIPLNLNKNIRVALIFYLLYSVHSITIESSREC